MKLFGHYRLEWNLRWSCQPRSNPQSWPWYSNLNRPWGFSEIVNSPVEEQITIRGWQFALYAFSLFYWPESAAPVDSVEAKS